MQSVLEEVFSATGMPAEFVTKELPEEALEETYQKVRSGELAGVLVTRPYKNATCAFMDELGDGAKAMQSVSLILPGEKGLRGSNTDWVGASEVIRGIFPGAAAEKQVLVLGAGGAAKAAAYACKELNMSVAIWNRTASHAKSAAELLGVEWVEDMRLWNKRPQVIINATSMSDQNSQSTLVPFALWEKVEFALDAVFGKTSLFLEEAKAMNIQKVLSGEDWFLYQMGSVFERITSQKAPMELLRSLIYAAPTLEER